DISKDALSARLGGMNYLHRRSVSQVHPIAEPAIGVGFFLERELQQVESELMVLGIEVPELSVTRGMIKVISIIAVDQARDFRATEEREYSLVLLFFLFQFLVVFPRLAIGFGDGGCGCGWSG